MLDASSRDSSIATEASGWLLQNWHLRDLDSLLQLLCFLLALLVGCALPCGDLVEDPPLRFHPDVGVSREHGA